MKIIFILASFIITLNATLTVINSDGSIPYIDTVVHDTQVFHLFAGGQIVQGPPGPCVNSVYINIIETNLPRSKYCTFFLNDAFGAQNATVRSWGDCTEVDLYFIQKYDLPSSEPFSIRIWGCFRNIFYYTEAACRNKLKFHHDFTDYFIPPSGIPPHFVGQADRSRYASVEELEEFSHELMYLRMVNPSQYISSITQRWSRNRGFSTLLRTIHDTFSWLLSSGEIRPRRSIAEVLARPQEASPRLNPSESALSGFNAESYRVQLTEGDPMRSGSEFTEKEQAVASAMLQGCNQNEADYMERLETVFSTERALNLLHIILEG